jgi:hypothetical protein
MDKGNKTAGGRDNVTRLPVKENVEGVELEGDLDLSTTEIGLTLARPGLDDDERARRRQIVEQSAHNAQLSGLRADDAYEELSEAFIEGTIDIDELILLTRAQHGGGHGAG